MSNSSPTRRRVYTDQEQADALAALDAHGGNVNATAAAIGVPEPTLRAWASGTRRPPDRALYEQSKASLADRFEGVVQQAVGVVEQKLPDASAAQAAVIAGIATDKMLLLRGEATAINSTADAERLAAFRARYAAVRPATPVTVVEVTPSAQESKPGQ